MQSEQTTEQPKIGELIKRRVGLQRVKKNLDEEKKIVSEQIAQCDAAILAAYDAQEIDRMAHDGATVFTQTELTCSRRDGVTSLEVVRALQRAKLSSLVSYHAKTLTSYLNEQRKLWEEKHERQYDGDIAELLPRSLRALVEAGTRDSVRVRGA